jgi:hypothetical protein
MVAISAQAEADLDLRRLSPGFCGPAPNKFALDSIPGGARWNNQGCATAVYTVGFWLSSWRSKNSRVTLWEASVVDCSPVLGMHPSTLLETSMVSGHPDLWKQGPPDEQDRPRTVHAGYGSGEFTKPRLKWYRQAGNEIEMDSETFFSAELPFPILVSRSGPAGYGTSRPFQNASFGHFPAEAV